MRALVILAIASCSVPDGDYFGRIPDRLEPRHLRWCNQGEPDHLDPALASSTASSPVVSPLFAGLTEYGMDGAPVPSLATSWDVSADQRTFTFHLRRDALWSNGRAVTAYDLAFTVLRIAHPLTASPNVVSLGPVRNANAYFAKRVFVLAVDAAPYRAGQLVEPIGEPPSDIDQRTARGELALRDLGAPTAASYARVPAGAVVTLVWTSGRHATLPSPDGATWAYVFWPRDESGVYGWVPAGELGDGPAQAIAVRALGDPNGTRVIVPGRALVYTPDVLGVRVIDAATIAFDTDGPAPSFVALTDSRAFRATPIEQVSRWPLRWTRPEHIVTSGPMRLVEWAERDKLELVRSANYWNPSEVKLDRLTILSISDQAAATNLYFTGECDATAANDIPSTYLPAIDGERGTRFKDFVLAPYLGVYFVWINTEKVTNRHLRRALSLAIDRTQIPRFTHGGEIPSARLTPGTPIDQLSPADLALCGVTHDTPGVAMIMETGALCYVPPPGLDFDLARAQQEIAAARAELGTIGTLHYRYNAGSEGHKQIAEYLQAQWAKLGLDVAVDAQEFNSMLADSKAGNFELLRLGQIGNAQDPESEFLELFACGASDNRGRYCSAEFETLMHDASTMADRTARNAKLREAESVMIEDAPVIPLYAYTQKLLIKPYVRDLAVNVLAEPPLWRAWIDPDWRTPK